MRRKDWVRGWMILGMVLLLGGCATQRDVQILDRETHRLYSELSTQQKEKDSLQRDMEKLREELRVLRTDTEKFGEEFRALRKETNDLKVNVTVEAKKAQADLQLRLENLQNEVRILSTSIEEYKDLLKTPPKEMDRLKESIVLQTKALEDREKILEEKDKALEEKNKRIEERLAGLEAKMVHLASKQLELEGAIPTKEVSVDIKSLSTRVGDLYKDAYETFVKGDVDEARRKFEGFLKQYPNTELSDNAQFWIGETYYVKKDYEKAILEYEKAIVTYPEGDKIPAALFKQALAFLELGDRTNGRNLLRRVIERYPRSDQAEMAKKRLETIK